MNTETFLPYLCEMAAKSGVILLLAALIVRICHRASAAHRHFVWLAAMAILLLLPTTRLMAPRWKVSLERPTKVSAPWPVMSETLLPESQTIPDVTAPAPPTATWRLPEWRPILIGAWVAGAVGLLAYRLLGSWRLRRLEKASEHFGHARMLEMAQRVLRELGVEGDVSLRISEECRVPMTWGLSRPVLMLPMEARTWNEGRLAAALRHEAGHIRRRDYFVRWLAHLACAIYWPNPLVWLAARSLRVAQEQATDDLVLRAGTPPEEYATQLFDAARAVAVHGIFARHAVAMATPSTLENRVLAIVDSQRDRRPLSRLAAMVGSIAITLTLAICTAAQLQAADLAPTGKSGAPGAAASGDEAPQIMIFTKIVEFAPELPEAEQWELKEATVYSDPEFQVVWRALNQKNGVELLSAPNLTTKSGQRATVEIVREFRYPTKWEKDATGAWKPKLRMVASSAPMAAESSSFETKNVGVSLDVEPGVKADGSIELRLKPSVVEFLGFIDLDKPEAALPSPDASKSTAERLSPPAIPSGKRLKPLFSERRIDTKITLQSGETVVLTGLNEADTAKPSGKSAPRRKMIVFVSAALVEPAAKTETAPKPNTAAERAAKIIIPKMEMREATLRESVDFLRKKSADLSPDGQGVNIILIPPPSDETRITLSLTDIPLIEAAKYVAGLGNLAFDAQAEALVIGTLPAVGPVPERPASPPSAGRTKAREIILPKIELREATLNETVNFLRAKSRELDPEKLGVNIVVKGEGIPDAKLTLTLTNIPLIEALHYVAELAGLVIRDEPNALVLQPKEGGAAPTPAPPADAAAKDGGDAVRVAMTADHVTTDVKKGLTIGEGHVELRCGAATITAESVRYYPAERRADVSGKVELKNGAQTVNTERMSVIFAKNGKMSFREPNQGNPPDEAASKTVDFAVGVPGKPGFVRSPFAPNAGMVDVRGFKPGTQMKCPYTGKVFVIPEPDPGDARNTTPAESRPSLIQTPAPALSVTGRGGIEVRQSNPTLNRGPLARRPGDN